MIERSILCDEFRCHTNRQLFRDISMLDKAQKEIKRVYYVEGIFHQVYFIITITQNIENK